MPRHRSRSIRILILAILVLATAGTAWFWLIRPSRQKPGEATTIRVYFHLRGDSDGPPEPVERRLDRAVTDPRLQVEEGIKALLAGPTPAEEGEGYFSSIPPDTALNEVRYERPFVHLDFNKELERTGGTARVKAILDQLAHTAASVRGVKGVFLSIEGDRVGTDSHPFTGEGFLFRNLHPAPDSAWATGLSPADTLDLFIAVIPDEAGMWAMMGPKARRMYKKPSGIETSAFGEGLGSWRDYEVESEEIMDDTATVVITGDQVLEGQPEPNARYEASMVREEGRWKWEMKE